MATHHAAPNEIVDLETWAMDLDTERSKVVFKRKELEVARLVLLAGETFKEHQVSGPITIQCIKGIFISTAMGCSQQLEPGQLVYLQPDEPHSLEAKTDSIILLTIIFKSKVVSS